jgi:peptidoglycan hydrolase CwlO-like protein
MKKLITLLAITFTSIWFLFWTTYAEDSITILSPSAWEQSWNNIHFAWNLVTNRFDYYEYILQKADWSYNKSWTLNQNFTWFTEILRHWDYTFTIKTTSIVSELRDRLNRLNSEISRLSNEIGDLQSSLASVEDAIPGIEADIAYYENLECYGEDEEWNTYTYSCPDTDRVAELEAELSDLESQASSLRSLIGSKQSQKALYESEKSNVQNSLTWVNISSQSIPFTILDDIDLIATITSENRTISQWDTINSRTAKFYWEWKSEDFSWYYYSITGTTFTGATYSRTWRTWNHTGEITLTDLSSWTYRFTLKMLSWTNIETDVITWKTIDFNVSIPATLKITYPTSWSTITSSNTTFTRTWYNDTTPTYYYELAWEPIYSTGSTSFTRNNLTNGNYTLTVWLYSWVNPVLQDSVSFTVSIPVKTYWGGWSSSKTHYTNNLKLSLWNDSPKTNERIKLIVKINEKYTGKVTFPKLQYYSPDSEKWIDIPVTSKNYVSDYSDDAKLWYIRFTSDDEWRKDLPQFIKFSKNWYYRIYAEDKDWYDEYVETYVGTKKTTTIAASSNTSNTTTATTTTTSNNTNNIDSIIQRYIPEIYSSDDTEEEVYISRSCKKYTIRYSESLNVYTSPNLNMNEYFISKDYFKRYIDSKNKYQSGCPTNIWRISTSYSDKTNDNTQYVAPNGKVYFITW